ncbi:phage replisome organizer N-terminal domain-containing protein [Vallitalea guaymasensis]|uniref:phage replisome organizer N-terminal domain-containing protein n=1 Tax=Vallitalea guaymasensis TaxID=1185412 RepID=UPI00193107A0|nr:phage replisome organizer N-terminal domain-containing protein [Vallitalea guaymasensis]
MLSEVKWIKITTNIFDDEKIKIIDTYPARDEILVIWFKLLALAGKSNQNGFLFMNDKIPYTKEMLAAIFNRDIKSIQMALALFQKFGMIEIVENELISITNWDKHQNTDGLDKIREQTRNRVAKHRQKKARLLTSNVTSNVTVTNGNAIEEEIEEEIEEDINNNNVQKQVLNKSIKSIYDYYSKLNLIKHRKLTDSMRKSIKKALEEYTIVELKELLNRHSIICELTRNNSYPVKKRGLDVFFSQKVSNNAGAPLIYEEYLEGGSKFERYVTNDYKEGENNGQHKGNNSQGNEQGKTKHEASRSVEENGYNTTDAADKVVERYGKEIDTSDLDDLPF